MTHTAWLMAGSLSWEVCTFRPPVELTGTRMPMRFRTQLLMPSWVRFAKVTWAYTFQIEIHCGKMRTVCNYYRA